MEGEEVFEASSLSLKLAAEAATTILRIDDQINLFPTEKKEKWRVERLDFWLIWHTTNLE